MLWVAMLMPNDQNTNIRVHETIDDRIRETVKRKPTTVASGRDAKAGVRHKESRDALELLQKPLCHATPGFFPVEASGLTKVTLGIWV